MTLAFVDEEGKCERERAEVRRGKHRRDSTGKVVSGGTE
jgi:hypothetical protein